MDGSSPRGRHALVVQRGWKASRLSEQFQSDAYRLALPPRSVAIPLAPPAVAAPRMAGSVVKIEARETLVRLAAAGGWS